MTGNLNARIIVCTHKSYEFPTQGIYLPLQVGAAIHDKIVNPASLHTSNGVTTGSFLTGDDTGDNISEKNDTYCELTGLYWAWKNLDFDVLGLVHYRRHFTVKGPSFVRRFGKARSILNGAELASLLDEYDILVPTRRRYYIETLYSHYAHTLDGRHLDHARKIVAATCPKYLRYVDAAYRRRWGYMFNMMVMKRKDVDAYCDWLFDILERMEEDMRKDGSLEGLSSFERRLFGRVSEILFNAWILSREAEGARVGEAGYLPMEDEQWHKKVPAFLAAKFLGKKYGGSFS